MLSMILVKYLLISVSREFLKGWARYCCNWIWWI